MENNIKRNTISNDSIFLNKDISIISLVDEIIKYGINNKASDIHIRSFLDECILEYRIDGILNAIEISKKNISAELIARLKIMAKLNVAEKRLPQDGQISYEYLKKEYDIRVAILPSINGENIVLRLLNTTLDDISLESLGFEKQKVELLKLACNKKNGLILITGPTGSGKSTTLLSLINILNNGKRKIISIEDPVENKVKGIVQIQVKEEIGLSFDNILRTTLRSDPDVIIISEIRDEITASIAIRAALTGHLVLTTLHTNDTITTFSRLMEMKIPKYLLLDSIICIISQRLIRLDEYDKRYINKRICVCEMLYLTDDIKEIFNRYIDKTTIEKNLKEYGFKNLEEEIVEKLKYERNNSL